MDTETGEILEGDAEDASFTEEEVDPAKADPMARFDDPPGTEAVDGYTDAPAALNAPLGEEAMSAAMEWLDAAAKEAKCSRGDVLDALNADVVQVAAGLVAHQERWAQMRPVGAAQASTPKVAGIDAVGDRGALLTYFLKRHGLTRAQLLKVTSLELDELDTLAEKEDGWPQAARWIEETFVQQGVTA